MIQTGLRPESALRGATRAAIAASPELTNQYRHARSARRPSVWKIFYNAFLIISTGPLMAVGIPLVVILGIEIQWGADGLLATGAVVSTIASLVGAQLFVLRLNKSRPISVSAHLPMADGAIARSIWRELAMWSLVALYFAALVNGCLAWKNQFGFGGWALSTGLATMQWLTCLATGTILVVLLPRFPYMTTSILASLGAVVYALAGAPRIADVIAAIYLLLPAGWVNAVLGLAFLQQVGPAWWAGGALLVWIAGMFVALRRLAQSYAIREIKFAPGSEATASLAPPFDVRKGLVVRFWEQVLNWLAMDPVEEERELSTEEAEVRILAGSFLQPARWTWSMWIERAVDRWFTDRERVVFEFLAACNPRWSEWWWGLAFGAVLFGVMPIAGPVGPLGNFGLACMIVAIASIAGLGTGPWPGFRTHECSGAFVPFFAVLPIGFDEISRVMLKVGIVRSLSIVLLLSLLAGCGFAPQNVDVPTILLCIGACGMSLIAMQGWVIGFYLSLGIRQPEVRLRTLVWHVVPLVLGVAGVLVGPSMIFAGFLLPAPAGQFFVPAGGIIVAVCSWGSWRLLREMYYHGRGDLVLNRRSSNEELLRVYDVAEARRQKYEKLRRKYGWFWWLRRTSSV